jgi:hypothetical protein
MAGDEFPSTTLNVDSAKAKRPGSIQMMAA